MIHVCDNQRMGESDGLCGRRVTRASLLLPLLRDLHPTRSQPRPHEQHGMLRALCAGDADRRRVEELKGSRRVCAGYIAVR